MELSVFKRKSNKKSDTKRIRLDGGIPAVVYSNENQNENIYIEKSEFNKILREIKEDRLSVTVITLKDGKEKQKVLVKDIQYHFTTYEILHLDFMVLNDKNPINVKIPIEYVGAEECAGVKLGGVLRRVIRKLNVRCLPKNMPKEFYLDVSKLTMGQSLKLRDISIDDKIKPISRMDEVAVVIAKR